MAAVSLRNRRRSMSRARSWTMTTLPYSRRTPNQVLRKIKVAHEPRRVVRTPDPTESISTPGDFARRPVGVRIVCTGAEDLDRRSHWTYARQEVRPYGRQSLRHGHEL